MATTTTTAPLGVQEKLNRAPSRLGILIFGGVFILGLVFIGASIARDLGDISLGSAWPYVLLGIALLVALGFEFVNSFHDTANAVVTVIYTHSLDPNIAVVWSGFWNFAGGRHLHRRRRLRHCLAPARGINSPGRQQRRLRNGLRSSDRRDSLEPWHLVVRTPPSSSHTLIGSIIGVGIANQLMSVKTGTSGVDWAQALNIGKSLLLSPIFAFVVAACLLLAMKAVIKGKHLYEAPQGIEPPFWIRGMLILTCTGVSFFHGSNDGQKGMGLIMLILIGTVPTTYALNHAVTPRQTEDFIAVSQQAADTVSKYVVPSAVVGDPRDDATDYIRTKEFKPGTMLALRVLFNDIGTEMAQFKQLAAVPREHVRNFRNDMYLVSEALRLMQKSGKPQLAAADVAVLKNYKGHIDKATRFIPLWVKVAVALALGLGTMIGWKRIVVTIGEKIGKNHLTYA